MYIHIYIYMYRERELIATSHQMVCFESISHIHIFQCSMPHQQCQFVGYEMKVQQKIRRFQKFDNIVVKKARKI